MNKKKGLISLLILVLAITLVSCNDDGNTKEPVVEDNNIEKPEEVSDDNNILANNNEDDNKEDQEDEEILVKLFFANSKYIETGDESLTKLISEERQIIPSDNILKDIYNELKAGPEDTENLSSVISKDIELKDSYIKDNIAFMDFSSENLHGGSLEELFFIDQIVASLLELENVDKVQFLVDGEIADSLMGHAYVEEPFDSIEQ